MTPKENVAEIIKKNLEPTIVELGEMAEHSELLATANPEWTPFVQSAREALRDFYRLADECNLAEILSQLDRCVFLAAIALKKISLPETLN